VLLAVGRDVGITVLKLHGFEVADDPHRLGTAAVIVFVAGIVHALGRREIVPLSCSPASFCRSGSQTNFGLRG
jgi:hypothetical protein